jgi:hypothetical protein
VGSARAGGGAGEELERLWAVLTAGGRGKSRGARGRRREGGPRDLFAKIEKSRDLTVN